MGESNELKMTAIEMFECKLLHRFIERGTPCTKLHSASAFWSGRFGS